MDLKKRSLRGSNWQETDLSILLRKVVLPLTWLICTSCLRYEKLKSFIFTLLFIILFQLDNLGRTFTFSLFASLL
ncbi:hypothetical protein P8452_33571 [Trifolium repens]|nr:hypothetical protein P8452_33571 [Trifolium repens]